MKKKVIIRGPILTRTGYGEQARFAFRALKSRPDLFDVYVMPTNWGHTGWTVEDDENRRELDQIIRETPIYINECNEAQVQPFDISIQVTIPQEWEPLAANNIGFTAGTETTHISANWIEKSNEVDRIIVVSEHTRSGFVNTEYNAKARNGADVVLRCATPVDVVNFPVKHVEPEELDFEPSTEFNFLTVAQWSPRKNLEHTVKWFIEEFIDNENVGLILKANIAKNCLLDRVAINQRLSELTAKYPDRKCKIYLLHGNLTDEEMAGLYQHPKVKALVNIAHGEGFGLPMFEAAANALPIVAPNWGGQKDYLSAEVTTKRKGKKTTKTRCLATKVDYTLGPIQAEAVWENVLIPESSWCYPTKTAYKKALQTVYKNHNRMVSDAKKLQASIVENFSEENQIEKFVDSVLKTTGASSSEFSKVVTL